MTKGTEFEIIYEMEKSRDRIIKAFDSKDPKASTHRSLQSEIKGLGEDLYFILKEYQEGRK